MSSKYVPPFLKNKTNTSSPNSGNAFAVLDVENMRDNSVVNTSLPAKIAPKLAPATLASLTVAPTAQHAKKELNILSEDDFPSLGGGPKPVNTVVNLSPGGKKFADMARGWAKKAEREEEAAKCKAIREECRRRERELFKTMPMFTGMRRRVVEYNDDDDYNPSYEDDCSIGDDSCEMPDENDEMHHDQEEEGEEEFNSNIGWDGRRREDLY
jgi:hypothetical protein